MPEQVIRFDSDSLSNSLAGRMLGFAENLRSRGLDDEAEVLYDELTDWAKSDTAGESVSQLIRHNTRLRKILDAHGIDWMGL